MDPGSQSSNCPVSVMSSLALFHLPSCRGAMSPEGGGERRRLDINSLKTEAEIEAAFLALDKEEALVGEELAGVLGRQLRLDQRLRGVLALAPRSAAAASVGKCAGRIRFSLPGHYYVP